MIQDIVRLQEIQFGTVLIAGLAVLALCLFFHIWRSETRIAALRRDNAELIRSMDSVLRSRSRETPLAPARRVGAREATEKDRSDSRTTQPQTHGPLPGRTTNTILALADPEPDAKFVHSARISRTLAEAVAEDRLEISLQPIVSISQGQAVAFEAYASVEVLGEGPVHVRRLAPSDALDVVDFDFSMFLATVQTARQRLGTMSERTRLHAAVSEELLSDTGAVSEICAILTVHPAILRSIAISLPTAVCYRADLLEPVRRLFDAGLSLALELESPDTEVSVDLPPIEFLKIDVDRLLSIDGRSRSATKAWLANPWSDRRTRIIAAGVSSEAQASQLIDLGVDLMTGNWFAEPRRLHLAAEAETVEAGVRIG